MKKDWVKFYILILISIILASFFVFNILKYTYVGTGVNQVGDDFYIKYSEPMTWSATYLKDGDKVLKLDGENPIDSKLLVNWKQIEQVEEMTIERDGKVINLKVDHEIDLEYVFHIIIPVVLLLLCIYCSYFIYKSYLKSGKKDKSSIVLILFLMCLSLAYVCGGSSARGEIFSKMFVQVAFICTPILYLHYLYIYFKELKTEWFNFRWIKYMYIAPIIVALITFFSLVIDMKIIGLHFVDIKNLTLILFVIIFGIVAYLIFRGYKVVSFKSQKYLIKILLIANTLAILPFVTLYAVPLILFNVHVFSPVILAGFLIIIPLALVYQFLATKIYDIEFLLGRLRYYGILITLPSIVSVIIVLSLDEDIHPAVYTLRIFISIALIMFSTLYMKEVFEFKFNLNRISEKNNYQGKLLEYTRKIRIASNFEEVSKVLKEVILNTLLIDNVYYFEVYKGANSEDINITPLDNETLDIVKNKYLETFKIACKNLGTIKEVDKGFILNIGEAEGKIYMLLALSPINTPRLTRDEIEWLKTLSYYTNVTLENFVKIEYLMENLEELENKPNWLNKIVFNVEEKQRSELAKDLHDSVLQDLLSINKQLEAVSVKSDNINETWVNDEVNKIISNMKSAIVTTRETCHQLRPQLLYDLGLERALKKLVSKQNEIGLNIVLNSANLDDNISTEIEINVYRIVQELLSNARKHSNAESIRLLVVRIKERIVINYEDNGNGADISKVFSKEESMGLKGIKERVNMLQGTFDVVTDIGKGFKVTIEI